MGSKEGLLRKVKDVLSNITVEPLMFSYVFSFAITIVTQVTLMMDKICRTELLYDDIVCSSLLKDPSLIEYKQNVQKELSQWLTIINYMQDIPSLILSLVIGPWSDKHGRKFPMFLVLFMRTLTFGGFLLNVCVPSIPTSGIVVSWVPTCLFGGFIFMLCLSYISDVTTEEKRTKRISILSGVSFLGFPIGILCGSYIFEYGGFVAVYATATGIMVFSCIYTGIRIKETRGDGKINKSYFRDMIRITNFRDSLQTVFKKRDAKRRRNIIVCLSALGLVALAYSVRGIHYQYTQLLYTWGNKEYSLFSSATSFFNKFVNIFVTPFLSDNLHFKETTIGIIGIISMIVSMIMTSLAITPEIFWAAGVLDGMVFMSSVSSRSILSTSVQKNEVGKAFGVASAFESIGGFVGGLIVQQLYRITLVDFPSCSYLLSGFVGSILLVCYLWMDVDIRKQEKMEVTSAVDMDMDKLDEKFDQQTERLKKAASMETDLNIDHMKNPALL